MAVEAGRKARPLIASAFDERHGQFSPDGRWITYVSNESGRNEVYVRDFPGTREKLRVSSAGGAQPQWGHDGRELFYIALDQKLMAVTMQVQRGSLTASVPQALFAVTLNLTVDRNHYVPDRTGKRFLVNTGRSRAHQRPRPRGSELDRSASEMRSRASPHALADDGEVVPIGDLTVADTENT